MTFFLAADVRLHFLSQVMQEFGYDETYAVASRTWAPWAASMACRLLMIIVDGHGYVMVMLWLCYDGLPDVAGYQMYSNVV